jgi:hypothetical protein
MSTTETPAQELPVIFKDKRFGDLVTLPNILRQNQKDQELLDIDTSAVIGEIEKADIATLELPQLEAINDRAFKARATAQTRYKMMQERRKQYTAYFDTIKSEFTDLEKSVETIGKTLQDFNNKVEREKHRRNEIAKADQLRKLQEENARIEREAEAARQAWAGYLRFRDEAAKKFVGIYNAKTAAELPQYHKALEAWRPNLRLDNASPEMIGDYSGFMISLRDDLMAGKKPVFEDVATTMAAVEENIAAQKEQAAIEAACSVVAVPLVIAAKGTSQKRVYAISTVNQLQKLAIWWVETQLTGVYLETAEKKLDFMITAANRSLNAGVTIEGIPTEESFSTRA